MQTPERIRTEIADLDYVGHLRPGLYTTQARRIVDFVAQERGLRANERSRLKNDLIGGIFEALRQNGEVDIPKNIEPKVNGMDLYSLCCCFAPGASEPSPLLHRMNGATHDLNHEIRFALQVRTSRFALTDASSSAGLVALADRIELWPIERLRPYDRNPRTHSDDQVAQIAASMVEFGWTNPILIDETDGILAGHVLLWLVVMAASIGV